MSQAAECATAASLPLSSPFPAGTPRRPSRSTPLSRRQALPPSFAPSVSHARTVPKDAVLAWESGWKSSARE
eukprot:6349935-Pyramimonas_sp.AAC.1